ncbi:MAG: hypothetical protein IH914_11125 [candidate division Zixibacteria bacterium]|nr:hypothetical protein [candidate division Zixibacteria bacterium]
MSHRYGNLKHLLPLLPAILVYAYFTHSFSFYQDDAYISFRYVANYLNGDGLVYNIGERVEGFTNFGWVIYLISWGLLGLDYILAAKITGIIFGAALIILTYLTARLVFGEERRLYALAAAYLVATNQSLAYWAPAGLETGGFALSAGLALYFYLRRKWTLVLPLMYAVLLRPDGAVIAGLLIVIELIQTRRLPRFTLTAAGIAALCVSPIIWFKLSYYGMVLPNSFYAKTSFDFSQLVSGLEYSGRFLAHYGFYGFGLIIPLLWHRKFSYESLALWLFTCGFTLYVISVGGDVLKVHRFFLPVFGSLAILSALSVDLVLQRFLIRRRGPIPIVIFTGLLALTFVLPRDFVKNYNRLEKNFTRKMSLTARELKKSDHSDFTVALPTIGIFGYELLGHDIIDMLGLTDSTIARYSEEPIAGMASTWKERKHNSKYLLGREPDYIVFSTNVKPSAPAEKALMLYPQFLRSYRTRTWIYHVPGSPGARKLLTVFKKVRALEGEIAPAYPLEYVELYKKGLEVQGVGKYREALLYFDRALKFIPRPDNLNLLYEKAFSHLRLKEVETGWSQLNYILEQDSLVYEAHRDLTALNILYGNPQQAELHKRWLLKLVPWYFPCLDTLTRRKLDEMEASRRSSKRHDSLHQQSPRDVLNPPLPLSDN